MTTTFTHPTTTTAHTRRRSSRPPTTELLLAFASRNPRQSYTGAPAEPTPPSWLANTVARLRNRRPQLTEPARSVNGCRAPADCDSAEEATQLVDRHVFFLDPEHRLEYGTIIGALDSPGGIPEFVISTRTGTVVKFGDEFKLSQLPDELLAS